MIDILPIQSSQLDDLIRLGALTFQESHGHSASPKDIEIYLRFAFRPDRIKEELYDPNNLFHFIYFHSELVGYSKIIPYFPYEKIDNKNVAKLERIYLRKEFCEIGLGQVLLDYNIKLAKEMSQDGIWLYCWTKNERGIHFYKKNGFEVIDEKDFKISNNHVNPNYIMYKKIFE